VSIHKRHHVGKSHENDHLQPGFYYAPTRLRKKGAYGWSLNGEEQYRLQVTRKGRLILTK